MSAAQVITDKLKHLAPAAEVSRIWGRMDAAEFERVHGQPMTEAAGGGAAANAWAANPEDVARELLVALKAAGYHLMRQMTDEDEAKDVW